MMAEQIGFNFEGTVEARSVAPKPELESTTPPPEPPADDGPWAPTDPCSCGTNDWAVVEVRKVRILGGMGFVEVLRCRKCRALLEREKPRRCAYCRKTRDLCKCAGPVEELRRRYWGS